ncbi:aminopeptidase P family protein [Neorhizobium lilium]|uniref:Aminopeptidase P family protein n=1 Tax=Neorhizobium lilium TaxID=2503024 RepID=A0A444LND0_9HYPH|nr:Xaa-Pro peptidase family protein [Neorhizobium lilium]RWX81803.1 aminopeptidase P family protein [Neorhizobium lilium]
MSDIDRNYAQTLMREAGLDGLALFQPESFRYAVGAPAGVATMWGRAGAAIALVPADASITLGAVASDHAAAAIRAAAPDLDLRTHRIWIDMLDLTGTASIDDINAAYVRSGRSGPRPETFDKAVAFQLLGDLLKERGLAGARIGVDLEFVPAVDFEALKKALPKVVWLDGSPILRRMRTIKSAREIIRLRRAALAAEAGLVRMAAAVKPQAALPDLSAAWKEGALGYATENGFALSGHWDFISVGQNLADMAATVSPGALIKADVGALVDGYSSDGARTFTYGPAPALALEIFKALEAAFACGLEQLRPGNSFCSVHNAMLSSMRRDGFSEYYRGHFGHSVGGAVGMEEWPFFSASNCEVIQPDMVVALEAPFYGQGLGALMIEDQFLITQTGYERMTTLPWTLRDLAEATSS